MQTRRLGKTDLSVSLICLGTMTYGRQNTEAEAHEQLDYAVANGVNFIDTAEMYPVPAAQETYGHTETIIGSWLAGRGKRDDVVIATKVLGPGSRFAWCRGGPRLTGDQILSAAEASLKRLGTDYIDLYQLHWPDRKSNFFGQLGYTHDPDEDTTPIEETLEALDTLVQAGKVRHIGLSNETPWGTMRFLALAEQNGWPRPVSVQNPYSLLNRTYEVGMAEVSVREHCGLLAYSPLAFGALSGKYLGGARPEKARMTLFPVFSRYFNEKGIASTQAYVSLAREHGLDPSQMALAFVNSRDFVTSNIIGATTIDQLKINIGSAGLTLSEDILDAIEEIHNRHIYPCP